MCETQYPKPTIKRCCEKGGYATKETLNLEKKVKTHDRFLRVNTSLLAICAVDIWLHCTSALLEGVEYISQQTFYKLLVMQLIGALYIT